jgi:hypothetical protein
MTDETHGLSLLQEEYFIEMAKKTFVFLGKIKVF